MTVHTEHRAGGKYMNFVLTMIAVLLGLLVLDGTLGLPTNVADAQVKDPPTAFNPAAQRNKMIQSLDSLEDRLKNIESRLTKGGIEVKVIEMPEVRIAE